MGVLKEPLLGPGCGCKVGTVEPRLTVTVSVILEYFVIGICSIKVALHANQWASSLLI